MKKILIISIGVLLLNSCTSDDSSENIQSINNKEVNNFNPNVVLPTNSLHYDYSSNPKRNRALGNTITSDQIVVTYPQYTYIGSLLNAKTIDNSTYVPVPFQLKL